MDMLEQAMGRFGDPASGSTGPPPPGAEARRAFTEVSQSGQGDPFQAAKSAWASAVQVISDRIHADGYQPADTGEGNLKKIVDFLEQSKGMDPLAATGLALEMLGQMGGEGGAPPGQEPPMTGVPGAGAPPPMGG